MTRARGADIAMALALFAAGSAADAAEWVTLSIKGHEVEAELAVTPAERARGLMGRRQLGPNQGMLFVYGVSAIQRMWMVNTVIPLSVAFIDEHGVIINIADMEPLSARVHSSEAPAFYALEVNQGWFAARGIGPGDRVEGLDQAASRGSATRRK